MSFVFNQDAKNKKKDGKEGRREVQAAALTLIDLWIKDGVGTDICLLHTLCVAVMILNSARRGKKLVGRNGSSTDPDDM